MRKWMRPAALLTLLLLTLSACGGEVQPQEESSPTPSPVATEKAEPRQFALAYCGDETLHPLKTADQSNLDVAALVYEGLYELDGQFDPQPILAESAAVSADGLVWTIYLREGAAFSDGTPLTAEVAAASLKTAMKGGSFARRLSGIASVKAKDGALVITLSAPNGALPALLDVPLVLEQEEGLPLGTGPYVFAGEGEEIYLAANPDWWQGEEPLYDRVTLRACATREERVTAFDSGEVTAVTTDFNASNALGYSGVCEIHDYSTTNLLYVGFNAGKGACADATVRAALSRAFDRDHVAKVILGGHGTASELPIHPESRQYSSLAAETLSCDTEAALALLEQAGYTPNEEGQLVRRRRVLSLKLVVNRDSLVKQSAADHLAQSLRALGMEVTVEKLNWEDYTVALAAGDFDLYLGEVRLTGDFDFSALVTGALNYGGYWNENVASLLYQWKCASGEERVAAAEALCLALAEDLPFAPLCFKENSLLVRWGLAEGLTPVRGNPFAGIERWQSAG